MRKNDKDTELEDRNILVTGAAGFIGSHLVRELLRRRNRVVCLVRPGESISRIKNLDCRIIRGDLAAPSSLLDAVSGADYIFHLAALLGGGSLEEFLQVNCEGTKNLIAACRKQGVLPKRFIFVSSTAVVGPSGKNAVLDESSPCRPVNNYARSKLQAEEYLASLQNAWPYTIIRLPVVYGPGSDGGLYIFFKLLSKRVLLDVGHFETSLCFVWDAVRGMIECAGYAKALGRTYILGESRIYSFQQICHAICSILGKRPIRVWTPYPLIYSFSLFSEIHSKLTKSVPVLTRQELSQYFKHRYWRFDTSKASRDFGFQSSYPFEQGAKITIDWYQQHGFI